MCSSDLRSIAPLQAFTRIAATRPVGKLLMVVMAGFPQEFVPDQIDTDLLLCCQVRDIRPVCHANKIRPRGKFTLIAKCRLKY